MAEKVLAFEQALAEVLTHARALSREPAPESVPLRDALGRTLAEPVIADRDQPPFHRSTRDGYAVRSADVSPEQPLRIVGSIRAGERWTGEPLSSGEALEIMTGAPLPDGADGVLMLEHASLSPDGTLQPEPGRILRTGENVVPRRAEAKAGNAMLPKGRVVGPAEIAVAASCGYAELNVSSHPRVAIVATGDELVEVTQAPEPWQIRNSNSYALAALVSGEGGHSARLPIARDTREDLFERISQASMFDLLLLSGGVSMGKYDLVEPVLKEFGAEFFFTGALIQPGKPIVFGRLPKTSESASQRASELAENARWTYFFGLPGNPVSTQVCFHLFVAPLLRALAGRTDIEPRFAEAKLAEDVKGGARVTRFVPAELTGRWDGVSVRVVAWQGSGDVGANARGNCYAVLPADVPSFKAGETVRVLLR